jgi:hypothetical protein
MYWISTAQNRAEEIAYAEFITLFKAITDAIAVVKSNFLV